MLENRIEIQILKDILVASSDSALQNSRQLPEWSVEFWDFFINLLPDASTEEIYDLIISSRLVALNIQLEDIDLLRKDYFYQLAQYYRSGFLMESVLILIQEKNKYFLDGLEIVDFEEKLKTAILITERKRLIQNNTFELNNTEIKSAFSTLNLKQRELLKNKFHEWDFETISSVKSDSSNHLKIFNHNSDFFRNLDGDNLVKSRRKLWSRLIVGTSIAAALLILPYFYFLRGEGFIPKVASRSSKNKENVYVSTAILKSNNVSSKNSSDTSIEIEIKEFNTSFGYSSIGNSNKVGPTNKIKLELIDGGDLFESEYLFSKTSLIIKVNSKVFKEGNQIAIYSYSDSYYIVWNEGCFELKRNDVWNALKTTESAVDFNNVLINSK